METLAAKPSGVHPSFMDSDAYADLRINSTAAGYAQINTTTFWSRTAV
ncbi:MAG: hypothetical protein U0787_22770 [Polyangia bacterium]